jgi:hypothetical protein
MTITAKNVKRGKLRIRQTEVNGVECFGLTTGKLWFAWAYPKRKDAETVLNRIMEYSKSLEIFDERIRINASHRHAVAIYDLSKD